MGLPDPGRILYVIPIFHYDPPFNIITKFIQMATGREGGVGHSLESCTTEISVIKHTLPELAYSDIYFVGTLVFTIAIQVYPMKLSVQWFLIG